MKATQYKVVHLDRNLDEKVRTCTDLIEVGRLNVDLGNIISITPQLVVDQICDHEALMKQAELEYSYSQKARRLESIRGLLEEAERKASTLRHQLSAEYLRK